MKSENIGEISKTIAFKLSDITKDDVAKNPEVLNSLVSFGKTELNEAILQFALDLNRFADKTILLTKENGEEIDVITIVKLNIENSNELKTLQQELKLIQDERSITQQKLNAQKKLTRDYLNSHKEDLKIDQDSLKIHKKALVGDKNILFLDKEYNDLLLEEAKLENKIDIIDSSIKDKNLSINTKKFNYMIDVLIKNGITKEIAQHITIYTHQGLIAGRANTLLTNSISSIIKNIDTSKIQVLAPSISAAEIIINPDKSISYKTSSNYAFDYHLMQYMNPPKIQEYKDYSRLNSQDRIAYNTEMYFPPNSTEAEIKVAIAGTGKHGNKIVGILQEAIPSANPSPDLAKILKTHDDFTKKHEPVESYKLGYEICLENILPKALENLENVFNRLVSMNVQSDTKLASSNKTNSKKDNDFTLVGVENDFTLVGVFDKQKFIEDVDLFPPGVTILSDLNKVVPLLIKTLENNISSLDFDSINELTDFLYEQRNKKIPLDIPTLKLLDTLKETNDKDFNEFSFKKMLSEHTHSSFSFSTEDAASSVNPILKQIANISTEYDLEGRKLTNKEAIEKAREIDEKQFTKYVTRLGDGGIYLNKNGERVNLVDILQKKVKEKEDNYAMDFKGMHRLLQSEYGFGDEQASLLLRSSHQGNFLGAGAGQLILGINNATNINPLSFNKHAIELIVDNDNNVTIESSQRYLLDTLSHDVKPDATEFLICEKATDYLDVKIKADLGTIGSNNVSIPPVIFKIAATGEQSNKFVKKLKSEISPSIVQETYETIKYECQKFRENNSHFTIKKAENDEKHLQYLENKFANLVKAGLSGTHEDLENFKLLESLSITIPRAKKMEIFAKTTLDFYKEAEDNDYEISLANIAPALEKYIGNPKSRETINSDLEKDYSNLKKICTKSVASKTFIEKITEWIKIYIIRTEIKEDKKIMNAFEGVSNGKSGNISLPPKNSQTKGNNMSL